MQPEQMEILTPGYLQYWNSADKKGYSGTVIFTKREPLNVIYGMYDKYSDEGRLVTLEYEQFYIVTCYSPNVQRELLRLDYRMQFEEDLRAYLSGLDAEKPVILCGDLNVAHNEIDLKNAKSNVGSAGFTFEERDKFTKLLAAGFTDSFRKLYPDRKDAYTWWSYFGKAREKNVGWRIDYFVHSRRLEEQLQDSLIFPEVQGSDHCPVGLIMDLSF